MLLFSRFILQSLAEAQIDKEVEAAGVSGRQHGQSEPRTAASRDKKGKAAKNKATKHKVTAEPEPESVWILCSFIHTHNIRHFLVNHSQFQTFLYRPMSGHT